MWHDDEQQIQQQIDEMTAKIAQQEARINQLEADCETLQRELNDFETRYEQIVGPIERRLKAVKQAIETMREWQMKRSFGYDVPLETLWERMGGSNGNTDIPRTDNGKSAEKPEDPDVKAVYRRLARTYHPDLATDEADRERRHALMSLINKAYSEQDAEALRALDQAKPERGASVRPEASIPFLVLKLRRLQALYRELADRADELQALRVDLRYGTMMELSMQEKIAGEAFLQEIAQEMEKEYWQQMSVLDTLRREND